MTQHWTETDYEYLASKPLSAPCYVYFIREKCGPVKIGISNDPSGRLKNMQTGNANELSIVGCLGPFSNEQAHSIEKDLHKTFAPMRIRGEWFKPCILIGGSIKTEHDLRMSIRTVAGITRKQRKNKRRKAKNEGTDN